MNCDEARVALGALVIGALEAAEADRVRAHLRECAECRAEYDELRDMPRLLGLVSLSDVTPEPPPPPPGLGEELLQRRSAERRRQRARRMGWTATGGVAVAAASAAVGFWVAGSQPVTGADDPANQVLAATDPSTGVSGEVHVDGVAWGTRLGLELAGVTSGETCSLVAVSSTGQRETAATWTVPDATPGDKYLSVPGAAGMTPDLIDAFEVVTEHGTTVLSLSFADLVE